MRYDRRINRLAKESLTCRFCHAEPGTPCRKADGSFYPGLSIHRVRTTPLMAAFVAGLRFQPGDLVPAAASAPLVGELVERAS